MFYLTCKRRIATQCSTRHNVKNIIFCDRKFFDCVLLFEKILSCVRVVSPINHWQFETNKSQKQMRIIRQQIKEPNQIIKLRSVSSKISIFIVRVKYSGSIGPFTGSDSKIHSSAFLTTQCDLQQFCRISLSQFFYWTNDWLFTAVRKKVDWVVQRYDSNIKRIDYIF